MIHLRSWGVLGISAFVFGLQALAGEPSRVSFRGDITNAGRTGVALRSVGQSQAALARSFDAGGLIWGSPVLDEMGNIYVGAANKNFYKIDPTGKALWTYRIFDRPDSLIDSAAALTASGKVIVPGGDGFLHALDRETGKLLWTFKSHGATDDEHSKGTVVNSFEGNVQIGPNGLIYAGSDNGTLYAIDETGHERWSFRTGMMVWSSPAIDPQARYMVFGSLDHKLYVLNPNTGSLLAKLDAGSEVKSSPALDDAGNVYFGTSIGQMVSLQIEVAQDGKVTLRKRWTVRVRDEVYSSPALGNGRVYFGSLDGEMHCASMTDGKLLWNYRTHSPVASSPTVSPDDVVVFGAKNGKLYALDAVTGERLWSFRTSPSVRKTNLDSSPAVSQDGTIIAPSYSGLVHLVPAALCAGPSSDARCEQGGNEDFPDVEGGRPQDGALLRWVDRNGHFKTEGQTNLGRYQPLQIKLLAFAGGGLIDRAAISAGPDLHIRMTPEASVRYFVSSDGGTLNIIPEGGFEPGTHYAIHVQGSYYLNTSWFVNRLKWLGLSKFAGELSFDTAPVSQPARPAQEHRLWGMSSLYLDQPQALDTLIPAALEGQAFLVSTFAEQPETGKFLMIAHPATPARPAPVPIIEPSRSFLMSGVQRGSDLSAWGSMRIAAMGGEIPFKEVRFTGTLDGEENFSAANFFVMASCLGLKGNNSSYSFPMSLLSLACDYDLRLIGTGTFAGSRLEIPQASGASLAALKWDGTNTAQVTLREEAGAALPTDALLSLIQYDPQAVEVTRMAVTRVESGCYKAGLCTVDVSLLNQGRRAGGGDRLQLYLGQTPLANVSR